MQTVRRPSSHQDGMETCTPNHQSSPGCEPISVIETDSLDSSMGAVRQQQQQHHSEHVYNLEYQQSDAERRPFFFPYIPTLLRFDHAPLEATGLGIDMWARITVFAASVFLGPALLQLATSEAMEQCGGDRSGEEEDEEYKSCLSNARVHGFKPSSLLSNIATVAGVAAIFILPLFGAITDHTSHRRTLGAMSAYGLAIIKMVELAISSYTWFAVACLQVLSSILYNLHIVIAYAYSSELSNEPHQQSRFQSHFFLVMFVAMFLYMVEVLLVGHYFGTGDVGTARIAVLVTCATAMPLFSVCWTYLFRDRPALAQVPPGQTLMMTGFIRLRQTSRTVQSELPEVRWLLRSLVFSEAGNGSFGVIGTTYMREFLGMSSLKIGVVLLVLLVSGIPGAWFGNRLTQRYNPIISAQLSLVVYIVTTLCASCFLSPGDQNSIFPYAVLWGICQGWLHPQNTTIFITITPKGQEVELMGLYLFVNQILGFLPPLFFTVLNETGVSIRWGLGSLNVFFAIGLMFLSCLGDYGKAMHRAQHCTTSRTSAAKTRSSSPLTSEKTPLEDEGNFGQIIALGVPG